MTTPATGPPGLQVVALISGGKDSLFSILHCQQQGHEVVALANVYPATDDQRATTADEPIEDIDSYMYQTIGHAVIPLYAEALGLPLYRQPIRGTNADANKVYAPDDADETESLVPLLRTVMRAQPSVNAVSTGAILSDYQRTRIESVALRLGIVPLAYLWQFPRLPPHTQTSLLEDMQAAGQDSRIVKVASGGLDESHLWLGLGERGVVQRLVRDFARFGGGGLETGAVLGEGGEFETLAINGPRSMWKRKIVIGDDQRTSVKGDGGAWMLRMGKAYTVEASHDEVHAEGRVREPDLLDSKFEMIRQQMEMVTENDEIPRARQKKLTERSRSQTGREPGRVEPIPSWQVRDTGDQLIISNMVSKGDEQDTLAQTRDIMDRLTEMLSEQKLSTANISLSIILLRSMSDFALVNKAYAEYFSRPSPPARVTIACGEGTAPGKRLQMTVRASRTPWGDRIGLHVQSRSYWAPANIGPYSQAISIPAVAMFGGRDVFVAGQIPLRPATMDIGPESFAAQALLAVQHLWRVGQAMRVQWWSSGAIAFVVSATREELYEQASIVDRCWTLAHAQPVDDEDEDEDEEDIAETSLYRGWGSGSTPVSIKTPTWPIPDWSSVNKMASRPRIPQCFTVQIDQLPRDAQVEWWSQGTELRGADARLPKSGFFALTRSSALSPSDKETLRLAEGAVDVFMTADMSLDMLELVQEFKALIVPCRSIVSRRHGEIETLFRYN